MAFLGNTFQNIKTAWPMTTRLLDIVPGVYKNNPQAASMAFKNFGNLVLAGSLTRILIGFARIAMDTPALNHNEATKEEKIKSTFERILIEIFGTMGYIGALAFGQDLSSKILNLNDRLNPTTLAQQLVLDPLGKKVTLSADAQAGILKALGHEYGHKSSHLMDNVLFGGKGNLGNILKSLEGLNLGPKVMEEIKPLVNTLSRKINRNATWTIMGGLAVSAFFGGVVMQYVNDYLFAPIVVPKLLKFFGVKDQSSADGKPSTQFSPATLPLTEGISPAFTFTSSTSSVSGTHLNTLSPSPTPMATPSTFGSLPGGNLPGSSLPYTQPVSAQDVKKISLHFQGGAIRHPFNLQQPNGGSMGI